jgi:hypothetical protein
MSALMPRILRPWRSQTPPSNGDGGEPSSAQSPSERPLADGHSTPGEANIQQNAPAMAPPAQSVVSASEQPAPAPTQQAPVGAPSQTLSVDQEPQIAGLDLPAPGERAGFGERSRIRRRLRFLRKARELAYRDLGGLVFDLHRFGQRHDELVSAKLAALDHIDGELRALQQALGQRQSISVLREAGIAACPRCAAIHGSDDRFCPACGMPTDRRAEHPIALVRQGPAQGAEQQPQQQQPATLPGQTSLPLPGATTIPLPQPSTRPWGREGSDARSGLLRPTTVTAPTPTSASITSEDQPTEIIPGSERPGEPERTSKEHPGGNPGAQ